MSLYFELSAITGFLIINDLTGVKSDNWGDCILLWIRDNGTLSNLTEIDSLIFDKGLVIILNFVTLGIESNCGSNDKKLSDAICDVIIYHVSRDKYIIQNYIIIL